MRKKVIAAGTVILIAVIAFLALLLLGKLILEDLTNISVDSKAFASEGIILKENALSETISVIEKESGEVMFSFPIPPEFVVEKIERTGDIYTVQFKKRGPTSN